MITGVVLKSWKTVKQHIPLIKFRKGGFSKESGASRNADANVGKGTKHNVLSSKVEQLPVIEDWQLPSHYRRALLDDKEIDAINSGGAY